MDAREAQKNTKRVFLTHLENLRKKTRTKNPQAFDPVTDEDARIATFNLCCLLAFDKTPRIVTPKEYSRAIRVLRIYGKISGRSEFEEGNISILERQVDKHNYFGGQAA